jgi:hypothetical protein
MHSPLASDFFVRFQEARLFVDKKHITVQTGPLWRSGSDELEKCFTLGHSGTRYVDNHPVTNFTIFGFGTVWRIRIRHDNCVVRCLISVPSQHRLVFYSGWCQFVTGLHRYATLVLNLEMTFAILDISILFRNTDLNPAFRSCIDHIGHDSVVFESLFYAHGQKWKRPRLINSGSQTEK